MHELRNYCHGEFLVLQSSEVIFLSMSMLLTGDIILSTVMGSMRGCHSQCQTSSIVMHQKVLSALSSAGVHNVWS